MSLLHPTLGDLIDRFTILELKLQNGANTISKAHFIDEWKEIEERLRPEYARHEGLSALHDRLKEVNADLWAEVDKQKTEYPHSCGYTACNDHGCDMAQICNELWRLNLHRRALMESIDRLTGGYKGPEKV